MSDNFKYDVFISYRHKEPDKSVAIKLQKLLENYKPPAKIGDGVFRKWRVFRDETELPASSDLGEDIKTALENSRYLIAVRSNSAVQSEWCREEINYFKKVHEGSNKNILTIIVEGTPQDVLTDELCDNSVKLSGENGEIFFENRKTEPLAVNIASGSTAEMLKKLKSEFSRIAAPLLGCSYDKLNNRRQKQQVRKIVMVSSVIIAGLILFGIYTGSMMLKISGQKKLLEKSNSELALRNTDILASQAKMYLENGDVISSVNTAVEALVSDGGKTYNPIAVNVLAKALKAYDTNTDFEIRREIKFPYEVREIAFSPDGGKIMVSDTYSNVYLIETSTGKLIRTYSAKELLSNEDSVGSKVAFSENYAYVLAGDVLTCINPADGKVMWNNATYTLAGAELIVNKFSDVAAVSDNFTNVIYSPDGELLSYSGEFSENMITDGVFVDSQGRSYIIRLNEENGLNELITVDNSGGKSQNATEIAGYVSCFGEDEKNIYVNSFDNSSNESVCGYVTCIDKETCSVKWESEYNRKSAIGFNRESTYYKTFFEYSYGAVVSNNEANKNSVVFFLDNEAVVADKENGEIQSVVYTASDVYYAGCDSDGEYVRIAATDGYCDEAIVFGDNISYLSKENLIEYGIEGNMVFCSDDIYAYMSSDNGVTVVRKEKNNTGYEKAVGFEDVTFSGVTEADADGIYALSGADIDGKNHLFIYDIENKSVILKSGIDFNAEYLDFYGDKNLILVGSDCDVEIYNKNGKRTLKENFASDIARMLSVDDKYIVFYDAFINDSILTVCTNYGVFSTTLSEDDMKFDKLFDTDTGIESPFAYGENKELIAFIQCRKDSSTEIAYMKKGSDEISYVKNDDGVMNFSDDEIISMAINDSNGKIAFLSNKGFAGIYDCIKEKFIQIDSTNEVDKAVGIEFSNNGKNVIMINVSGKILNYSADNGKKFGEFESGLIENGNYSAVTRIDDHTLLIESSDKAVFFDTQYMQPQAEIENFRSYIKSLNSIMVSVSEDPAEYGIIRRYSADELLKLSDKVLEYLQK